ncbi:MAG TPA: peptidoglycan-binding protein [Acetobacteraceae bacterium]|nr:peptidoglycan-binding protein [Acetobacteraceae bacterium]
MPWHTVRPGDCINSIAFEHGLFWETVWNDGNNAALRRVRPDPNVLEPGDQVFVTDPRIRYENRPTDARHRFRIRGVPARFQIQLLVEGKPWTGQPYVLWVDGVRSKGSTDGSGWVRRTIPPEARSGTLIVGTGDESRTYTLNLGHLDPVETPAGAIARLVNLGFAVESSGDAWNEATTEALAAFQASAGIEPTGTLDGRTQSALRDAHDVQ